MRKQPIDFILTILEVLFVYLKMYLEFRKKILHHKIKQIFKTLDSPIIATEVCTFPEKGAIHKKNRKFIVI